MINIYFILSIFMIWVSFRINKDMIAPPVILSSIWAIMYFILLISTYPYNSNDFFYIVFLLSNILFLLSFTIALSGKRQRYLGTNKDGEDNNYYLIKKHSINIFIFIEILILIYLLFGIIKFTSSNFEKNIWFSLKYGRAIGTYYEGELVERFRVISISMLHILGIIYFKQPFKINKKYYYIQLIITLILVVTGVGRTTLFTMFIPLVFSYLYIKNPSKKRIVIVLIKTSIFLLAIFILYAYMKFPYLVGDSTYEFIMGQLQIYTVSPMIAFVEWCNYNNVYSYGAYTFRFFGAILSAIGLDIQVPNLVSEYVLVGNDLTNVYTVLHYYSKDFGIVYALFMQIIIGGFHGVIYRRAIMIKNASIFTIAIFTLFFYSLIMQFFIDQYLSLLSQWIQYILYYYFISRTKIFINIHSKNQ